MRQPVRQWTQREKEPGTGPNRTTGQEVSEVGICSKDGLAYEHHRLALRGVLHEKGVGDGCVDVLEGSVFFVDSCGQAEVLGTVAAMRDISMFEKWACGHLS